MEQIKSLISSVDFYMKFIGFVPTIILTVFFLVTVRRVTPQKYSYFIIESK